MQKILNCLQASDRPREQNIPDPVCQGSTLCDHIHISVDFDWIPGSDKSVPKLFDLFKRYGCKPSLFFTGGFARAYPEIVQEALRCGYEIGTHGLNHGWDGNENFGMDTPYEVQHVLIAKSTEAILRITSTQPIFFRAPLLKISPPTYEILAKHGYLVDSSVPARRYDFGAGSVSNLKSFMKPTKPYYVSTSYGNMLEIPPSACILPLNMRMLRTFPFTFVYCFSALLARIHHPLVFYLHPAEYVPTQDMKIPQGFYKGFYDNCGPHNFTVLERFLTLLQAWGLRSEFMARTLTLAQGNPETA